MNYFILRAQDIKKSFLKTLFNVLCPVHPREPCRTIAESVMISALTLGGMLTRELSSLQHPVIKHLVKLRENRDYRYQEGHVLLSGLKLLAELEALTPFRTLLIEKDFQPSFPINAQQVFVVTTSILKKVTGLLSPEPIAAEVAMPVDPDLSKINSLLILDGISDPGNLGTLLRTALGLGWEGAFVTSGSTDPYNEKALRAAKGATFKLPWKSGTWEELKSLLEKGKFSLLAADPKGAIFINSSLDSGERGKARSKRGAPHDEAIDEGSMAEEEDRSGKAAAGRRPDEFMKVAPKGDDVTTLTAIPPIALALGNEAHGLQKELLEKAKLVAIPMAGPMESLNVASAGAILMFFLKGVAHE